MILTNLNPSKEIQFRFSTTNQEIVNNTLLKYQINDDEESLNLVGRLLRQALN